MNPPTQGLQRDRLRIKSHAKAQRGEEDTGYFYSRRGWFFGVLAGLWVIDFFDTLIKGADRLQAFGIEYEVRAVVYIVCCLVAMKTKNAVFHACFAVTGSIYELAYFFRQFFTVG